jgi:hypothetical protein
VSEQKGKDSKMQYLPLVNTALIAIFVLFIGYKAINISDSVTEYAASAKKVNDALVIQINGLGKNLTNNLDAQFASLKNSIFDPIKSEVIDPLSEASINIKSLTELLGKNSFLLQERADSNEHFTRVVLKQLEMADAVIYADELEKSSEPAELWAKRAKVEIEIIKWVAWNEYDVLYRLALIETSMDFGWHKPRQRNWMIKGPEIKKQKLYEWFSKNIVISKYINKQHELNRKKLEG